MLYDPNWQKPKVADVFSLDSLIAWLETMPADISYKWDCVRGGCLIGIYADAAGINFHDCHSAIFDRGQLYIAGHEPHTFGAALARARKAAQAS